MTFSTINRFVNHKFVFAPFMVRNTLLNANAENCHHNSAKHY